MANSKDIKIEDGDYLIIDPSTSEVMGTFGKGDTIYTKEQKNYNNEYESNYGKGRSFMKLYDDYEDMLTTRLTNAEIVFVLKLRKFVSYNDAILRDNFGQGEVLTYDMIADKTKMSYSGVRKLIESLMKKGVLAISKTGTRDKSTLLIRTIHANPNIFIRGTKMSRSTSDLFRNSGW